MFLYMSSFFDQIIKKILPSSPNPQQPLVTELLKRTEVQQNAYKEWLTDQQHISLLESVAKAYFLKQEKLTSDIQIHLFASPYANGFAITYDESSMGKQDLMFLCEHFKDIILTLNYELKSSQREITDKGNFVNTVERYYLKPEARQAILENKRIDQLYGNLLLEYVLVDEKPSYLKVLSTIYADRTFTPAQDFNDLIQILFRLNE
ncbi:hypothetical protein BKI52_31280 [marine bacterium AO1-C]|nr:hypothetical protein BKI52_31280 [marine bacterium AO1-C]